MATRKHRKSKKAGLGPGALIHIGERKVSQVGLTTVVYDKEVLREQSHDSIESALAACEPQKFFWLNVEGVHDTEMIARIGERFGIHPLTLEDVLNTAQRPKLETYDQYDYIVLKMLNLGSDGSTASEQISLILTSTALISFQESTGRLFDPIRERLRKDRGRIRISGGDYLAYALLDAVVDQYFVILVQIAQKIDEAEEETMSRPGPDTAKRIHALKRTVIFLHRHIWPLREVVGAMAREGNPVIQEPTRVFLRDVHDHSLQVIDTIEAFRDVLSNLLDIYLSTVSNRMNEVMKVLTMIATIFIPVTFVAGLYGMNFRHMPELEWTWGYPLVWAVMIAMMGGMLIYFKKKNWF